MLLATLSLTQELNNTLFDFLLPMFQQKAKQKLKPTIYTCNIEWLNGNHEKKILSVHFDTSHKNILAWDYDKLEEFKIKLTDRVNSIIP